MTRKSRYDPLFQKLETKLPPAFKKNALSEALDEVLYSETKKHIKKNRGLDLDGLDEWTRSQFASDFENINQRKGLTRLVKKQTLEIKYKTHGKFKPPKIYSFRGEVDGLDFANAFATESMYFSNLSALYIHGLIDQRPLSHYISKEVHFGSKDENDYDEDLAKLTFRKKARVSTRYVSYKDTRLYFLEKQNIKNIGIEKIRISKKDRKEYYINCTNLERTFIDSIITPQYSGGTEVIVAAFRGRKLNLDILYQIYNEIEPIYPYWQKVGFLLDVIGRSKDSSTWSGFFKDKDMKKFFSDREYRSDWLYNKKWSIYYPAEMDVAINEG